MREAAADRRYAEAARNHAEQRVSRITRYVA
jgi:hypothetical protein